MRQTFTSVQFDIYGFITDTPIQIISGYREQSEIFASNHMRIKSRRDGALRHPRIKT